MESGAHMARTIIPATPAQQEEWRRTGTIACSGACDQGRKACTTPEACELPDAEFGAMSCRLMYYTALVALICAVSLVIWAVKS